LANTIVSYFVNLLLCSIIFYS